MPSLYGTWTSPITPRVLAESGRFDEIAWDTTPTPDGGATLVWTEKRGAGSILVAQTLMPDGYDAPRDLTTEADRVGGRVGYGGGEVAIYNGIAYFAGAGGRLYRVALAGGQPRAITPAFGSAASPAIAPDGQWIAYVHTVDDVDGIALVDVEGAHFPRKFAYGSDFVMQPAWHPAGTQFAYVAWDHPNMPWDATTLWLAEIAQDTYNAPYITSQTALISGSSVFQPTFSPDGRYLAYVGESKGWWQLFVYDLLGGAHRALTSTEAEHAIPAWRQGMRTFAWLPDGSALVFLRNTAGFSSAWRIDIRMRQESQLLELESYTHLAQIAVGGGRVALIASSSSTPARVISAPLPASDAPLTSSRTDTGTFVIRVAGAPSVHRRSMPEMIPVARLSFPQSVAWTSDDGTASGAPVYGLYYPPEPEGNALPSGLPPLIVMVHGGPTTQTVAAYSAQTQFFATRGYAVLWVNYRGSTGYGRAYRDALRGGWGVIDVEDAAAGATYLAANGLVDPAKYVIMGSSAGGYTVLQSLVLKPGFYRAGVSLYGISDQFALAAETHKFEARYTDSLIGALPEAAARYRERSPIFHAEHIRDPLLLLHGADDNNVPPNQSEMIAAALKRRGVPHEHHVYAGEGHGFRKPETIEAVYRTITAFLTKHVLYAG
jgi:dipeptidyl aminopeptidase/acylaminoacyl peptidase